MAELNKLKKEDVHYLSFEGGGGKGNAYPGVITALKELGILQFENGRLKPGSIKGVAGASAGAITALMVACGYNDIEIKAKLKAIPITSFFEPPQIGIIPKLKDGFRIKSKKELQEFLNSQGLYDSKSSALTNAVKVAVITGAFEELLKFMASKAPKSALNMISILYNKRTDYLNSLLYDWGFFSGIKIREFFSKSILEKLPGEYKKKFDLKYVGKLSFKEYKTIFDVDLAVTGSNFSTGKSEVFSASTTPLFPVVDAVRISMSIPFIFKPVNIGRDDLKGLQVSNPKPPLLTQKDLGGVWVDGGFFNNLPFDLFNADQTLAIQLDDEPELSWGIYSFLSFIQRYLEIALFGGGNAKVSTSYLKRNNIITIDAKALDLLDFSPGDKVLQEIWSKAIRKIKDYFKDEHP